MEPIRTLTDDDVINLPEEKLPMLVFSSSLVSFMSFGVRAVKKSQYSHFMWAHRPGYFASQHMWYKEVPVQKFFSHAAVLKFWTIDDLPTVGRYLLIELIKKELAKPWWRTRYDLLAILGQLLGWASLQCPWNKICSEHANHLYLIDSRYPWSDEKSAPAPSDINAWLKTVDGYSVYGKYYIEE
jgi:hypothetical protein